MLKPAHYVPFDNGRYEVKAGLSTLNKDFGNAQDKHIFQVDEQWPAYFQAKQQSREEDLEKYYLRSEVDPQTYQAVCTLALNQLGEEHPDFFKVYRENDGNFTLECELNQARAHFTPDFELISTQNGSLDVQRRYVDVFDFICSHIQEDVSLIKVDGDHDQVAALHLCFPNHWAGSDKIGKCFAGAHIPVPNMEKINKNIATLSHQLIHKGPFVRFAWGLATDARLNHHPQPPEGTDPVAWRGRYFNSEHPQLFTRVERQCIAGIPKVDAYLFFIRTYIENVTSLSHTELKKLYSAIESMDEHTLKYKGLHSSRDDVLSYLDRLSQQQGTLE